MFRDNKYVLVMLLVGIFFLGLMAGWSRMDSNDVTVRFEESADRYVRTSLPADYKHQIDFSFVYFDKDSCSVGIIATIDQRWDLDEPADSSRAVIRETLEDYLDWSSQHSCVMNLFTYSDTSYVFGDLLNGFPLYYHGDDGSVDWRVYVHVEILPPGISYDLNLSSEEINELSMKIALRDSLMKEEIRWVVRNQLKKSARLMSAQH